MKVVKFAQSISPSHCPFPRWYWSCYKTSIHLDIAHVQCLQSLRSSLIVYHTVNKVSCCQNHYKRASWGIFFKACRTPRSPNTSSAPARTNERKSQGVCRICVEIVLTSVETWCSVVLKAVNVRNERKTWFDVRFQLVYPCPLWLERVHRKFALRLDTKSVVF